MSEKILEKILEKVENIEKTMATKEELKEEVSKLATKKELKEEVSKLATKEELKEEVGKLTTKIEHIENTMATKEAMDRNTSEIAQEIRELAESISRKAHQEHEAIRKQLELNNKDHKVFAAQIERLQIAHEYIIEEKVEKLA